jgi:hypothetical protein
MLLTTPATFAEDSAWRTRTNKRTIGLVLSRILWRKLGAYRPILMARTCDVVLAAPPASHLPLTPSAAGPRAHPVRRTPDGMPQKRLF